MTIKMLIGDPPATTPTLHAPPLTKFYTDVEEDLENNLLMLPPKPTMSMMMLMTSNSETPKKMPIGDPTVITSDPHKTQPMTQPTANAVDTATNDCMTPPLTPILTKWLTTTNTETIAKLMLCTPEQSHATTLSNTPPLPQSTAEIADDAFHMTMLQAMMLPTMMPRSEKTEHTMNCITHQQNATAPTFKNISPLTQSTAHTANEANEDYPRMMQRMTTMLMTKPRKKMPMTKDMEKTANCTTHQSSANVPTFSNPPSPMQPTDTITDNVEDDFLMMMQTRSHNMTHDNKIHDPVISHSDPAINWISESYAPIFNALDCQPV